LKEVQRSKKKKNLDVHLLQTPSAVTKPVALQYCPHSTETQLYSVKIRHIEKYKREQGRQGRRKKETEKKETSILEICSSSLW
jgi:hypothetical protein